MKTTVEVIIDDKSVQVDNRYFYFKYNLIVDGKETVKMEYDSDHMWGDDLEGLKKVLIEDKYAVELALEDFCLANLTFKKSRKSIVSK